MSADPDRREFIKHASLLPVCAVAAASVSTLSSAPAKTPGAPRGSAGLKLSLNAYSFNQLLMNHLAGKSPGLGLLELLEFCARNDFDALDPTGYYFPGYPDIPDNDFLYALKRRAHQLGVAISGTGIRNDFATPDAAKRAADVVRAKAWIEVAARLGAPVLRVFAGAVPEGYADRWNEAAEWMIEALRECAAHGAKHGVLVGVQNHGDMLQTAEQTLHVVEAVGSDWFGVIVDTGNMNTSDPYVDIARVVPHAVNWQVKESPRGKNSPERIDLPRLMRIIKEGGYRGYLPIETLVVDGKSYDPYELVPKFGAEVRAAIAEN